MSYERTTWVDDTAPDIDAENLNNMEQGIVDAHSSIDDIVSGSVIVGKAQLALDLDPSYVFPNYITPVGSVVAFVGTTAPDKWAECAGQAVNRTGEYAPLFAVMGTSFGAGNGTTTFNLPDTRGKFKRGWDHGAGVDPARNVGTSQGDELKSHGHTPNDTMSGTNVGLAGTELLPESNYLQFGKAPSISNTGGSETRPKNVCFMDIVRYK